MLLLPVLLLASWHLAAPRPPQLADTIRVERASRAPVFDGRASDTEYGAPTVRMPTPAGVVQLWMRQHGEHVFIGASIPDSTFYWGDDLVVSIDAAGVGGAAPADGDRQWYIRRTMDSSTINVAQGGGWYGPGRMPATIGAVRDGDDWNVASASSATGWSVELRLRASAVRSGGGVPRIAFRTYNDAPHGWSSWPAPPAGVPAGRVERAPSLWVPMRLP